jgi:hypothetical protein
MVVQVKVLHLTLFMVQVAVAAVVVEHLLQQHLLRLAQAEQVNH